MVDQYGNYTGQQFGHDRLGYTTPDPEGCDPLCPWLPSTYPAPWLPARRIDSGHPVGANIALTAGQLVGLCGQPVGRMNSCVANSRQILDPLGSR